MPSTDWANRAEGVRSVSAAEVVSVRVWDIAVASLAFGLGHIKSSTPGPPVTGGVASVSRRSSAGADLRGVFGPRFCGDEV
ncbi:uncharacterized protein N7487_002670 [Penicillium crustosum]|uniref:uncharacterized protein n=1 Tax=Penicillium crustosum TaxID=36656 RepID=UPI00239599F7|nr:uncharacterized protein N7487_002670 [Penicillium crustosum]KAJ5419120.1 hypothetical protein N7487_002670 [Penicillium crustosum]